MKSRDSRNLPMPPGGDEALQAVMHFISDRSVALVIDDPSRGIFIGSGTCILVGERFLVATAGHNLSRARALRIQPRGERGHRGIPFISKSHPRSSPFSRDLGWLELDPTVANSEGLRHIGLADLRLSQRHAPQCAFAVQGFPAQEAIAHSADDIDPFSLVLLTNTVPSPDDPELLVLDYPPKSQEDAGLELVHPEGMSGGGVWLFPPFSESLIWVPDQVGLAGVSRAWLDQRQLLLAEPVERWLELVSLDFPDLAPGLPRPDAQPGACCGQAASFATDR